MMVIVAVLGWLALGLPSAWVFRRHQRMEFFWAIIPLAGAMSIAMPVVAAAWFSGDLTAWPLKSAVASVVLAGLCEVMMVGARRDRQEPVCRCPDVWGRIATSVLWVWLIVQIGIGVILVGGGAGFGWDGYSIWLLHAKVLAGSESFPVSVFTEPQLAKSHWDYPLQLPAFLAWFMRVGNLGVHQLGFPLSLLLGVFPVVSFYGFRHKVSTSLAAVLAFCPLLVLRLADWHYDGYADPLLVVTAVTGLGWGMIGVSRHDRASLVGAGLLLAMAVSLKNEGILWLVAVAGGCGAWMVYVGSPVRRGIGDMLRIVFPGLLAFVLWQAICMRMGLENDVISGLDGGQLAERLSLVLGGVLGYFGMIDRLALLILGVGVMAVCVPGTFMRRAGRIGLLLVCPLIYVAGMVVIYLCTPHDVSWHMQTSLERTLAGVLPAIVVLAVMSYVERTRSEPSQDGS